MPRKAIPHDPTSPQRAREELLRGTTGQDFTLASFTIRCGDIPLFRRDPQGGLRQAVRLVVQAPAEAGDVTFALYDRDELVDQVTTRITTGRHRVLLFTPEVTDTRTLLLRVTRSEGSNLGCLELNVRPQRKWTVYLIHHSHLDIGYTDPQGLVLRHHLAYLDAVLDLAARTDDWPDDAQFRWNVEANWPLRHWLATRPTVAREVFLERVRQGRIEVTALPFNMHTEAYAIDELARQLYFADELRERYGIPIVTAMQTDVPGATVGLLNLLVDAGIRYLVVAHNYAGRAVPFLVSGQQLSRPFYWHADNGKELLVWYTDTTYGLAYMEGNILGLAESAELALDLLPEYLAALATRPYPYGEHLFSWQDCPPEIELIKEPYPYDLLHLRLQSTIADNAPPSLMPAEVVRQWNLEWAFPRLRLATNRDFFTAVEARLGSQLAHYAGDWTNWWADGIASGARALGYNRRAQGTIRAVQTVHTMADLLARQERTAERTTQELWERVDRVYDLLALFDEHTWGAANPWEDRLEGNDSGALQWEKKASFAQEAYDEAMLLLESGLQRLAYLVQIDHPAYVLATILVVNPSAWPRTDVVRVFVPESRVNSARSLAVRDPESGELIPSITEPQEHAPYRPAGRFLTFVAHEVPPCGYRVYWLVEEVSPHLLSFSREQTLENQYYRVEIDPRSGCIVSLVDKDAGRELVNTNSRYGFNCYIYDRYTSAPRFNHLSSRIQAHDLTLLGRRSVGSYGVITERASTPVWDRVTVRLQGEGAEWIEVMLTLLREVKRLDICNRVMKVGTIEKEGVFFCFPFALNGARLEYELTGGVSGPNHPHVPGSARHMRAIRHWATLDDGQLAVAWATLEAPLVQVGNLYLPYAPFPPTLEHNEPATLYSWAVSNIWDTNFPPAQAGEMVFRYAVASGPGGRARELGVRTAASLTQPLLGIALTPGSRRTLPTAGSFCRLDHPEVEVVALAPSRRGHDLTVFLYSHAAEPVEVGVSFPLLPVRRAWHGTYLERELREISLVDGVARLPLAPGSYTTLSLELATNAQPE